MDEHTEEWAREKQRPWTPRWGHTKHNEGKCCAAIWHEYSSSQCNRKPKVFYGALGYCGTHDPVAVKARLDARNAKWNAESAANRLRWKQTEIRAAYMTDCEAAIKEIAAGHNDPRTLAKDILVRFELAMSDLT